MGKQPKPTKAEAERITRMMELGCVACAYLQLWCPADECHHILEGNKRLGHWYTLPLCRGHHRGEWRPGQEEAMSGHELAAISDGRKRFNAAYPTERELWKLVQIRLKLPQDWPESKIMARRY